MRLPAEGRLRTGRCVSEDYPSQRPRAGAQGAGPGQPRPSKPRGGPGKPGAAGGGSARARWAGSPGSVPIIVNRRRLGWGGNGAPEAGRGRSAGGGRGGGRSRGGGAGQWRVAGGGRGGAPLSEAVRAPSRGVCQAAAGPGSRGAAGRRDGGAGAWLPGAAGSGGLSAVPARPARFSRSLAGALGSGRGGWGAGPSPGPGPRTGERDSVFYIIAVGMLTGLRCAPGEKGGLVEAAGLLGAARAPAEPSWEFFSQLLVKRAGAQRLLGRSAGCVCVFVYRCESETVFARYPTPQPYLKSLCCFRFGDS